MAPKRKAEPAPAPALKRAKKETPSKGASINQAPSQKLDIYVMGENSGGELGLGTAKNAKPVRRPRLNPLLSKDSVGVVQLACGGMHAIALTHGKKHLQPAHKHSANRLWQQQTTRSSAGASTTAALSDATPPGRAA